MKCMLDVETVNLQNLLHYDTDTKRKLVPRRCSTYAKQSYVVYDNLISIIGFKNPKGQSNPNVRELDSCSTSDDFQEIEQQITILTVFNFTSECEVRSEAERPHVALVDHVTLSVKQVWCTGRVWKSKGTTLCIHICKLYPKAFPISCFQELQYSRCGNS